MDRRKSSRFLLAIFCLASVLGLGDVACQKAEPGPQPPVAEKIIKEFQEFGKTRVDNYYWLKERENPKVLEYLKAENKYLEAVLKPTEALQEKLYQEIVGRIKQ
ncbi:MAG TPA: oligopeptidase B, partial [Candidatus Aminicenantes bacterium]|nr:oligopeptidase B [Candidatus Aminicenantes bacterium]